MRIFVLALPNAFCRDSSDNFKVADVFGNNSTGSNNCSPADFNTRKNYGPGANKNIIFNFYWFFDWVKSLRLNIMFGVVDHNLRSYVDMITDSQRCAAIQNTVVTDNRAKTNRNSPGIVKLGTHVNVGFFADLNATGLEK